MSNEMNECEKNGNFEHQSTDKTQTFRVVEIYSVKEDDEE